MGIGTIASPYTMLEGIKVAVKGDTLLLRGGVYTGHFTIVSDSPDPVTISPYSNEKPIIHGSLTLQGDSWIIQGLEIFDSAYVDRTISNGKSAISADANHLKVINCILHDNAQGLTSSPNVTDLLVYGTLMFHNGWLPNMTDVQGHGTYPQNANLSGRKTFKHCISFNNGYGYVLWGASGEVNNFTVEECAGFGGGWIWRDSNAPNLLMGGQSANQGHRLLNSIFFDGTVQIGYGTGNDVTDTQMIGNILECPLNFIECIPDAMYDNQVYGALNATNYSAVPYSIAGTFPANTYGSAGNCPDFVRLFANEYDSNRAQVIIFNQQAGANAILVSVPWPDGSLIIASNVQDLDNDRQNLTVSGGQISINMQASNRTVSAPVGSGYFQVAPKIYPDFGVFILERQIS